MFYCNKIQILMGVKMNIELESIYLIISKDEKLIAKGIPRNRYICHIDEKDNKRILTYASKAKAKSAYEDCGFYLSRTVEEYIEKEYPEIVKKSYWVSWNDIKHLFEAREFNIKYESK
jgi:hypothetical protein